MSAGIVYAWDTPRFTTPCDCGGTIRLCYSEDPSDPHSTMLPVSRSWLECDGCKWKSAEEGGGGVNLDRVIWKQEEVVA
jgi:hypothetical protein